jgi:hypothetical protein
MEIAPDRHADMMGSFNQESAWTNAALAAAKSTIGETSHAAKRS